MKLRLPQALLTALVAVATTTLPVATTVATGTVAAIALLPHTAAAYNNTPISTTTYNKDDQTTYSGIIFTYDLSITGQDTSKITTGTSKFSVYRYDATNDRMVDDKNTNASNTDQYYLGNASYTLPGATTADTVWHFFTGPGANCNSYGYGSTLRLVGASANTTLKADFSPLYLGGLITAAEADNVTYTLGRTDGDIVGHFLATTIDGVAQKFNMNIGANTTLTFGTYAVESDGVWNIAQGKTLTFSRGKTTTAGYGLATIATGKSVEIKGGGTAAFNYGLTTESGSTLSLTGGSNITVSGAALTLNGTMSIASGATLSFANGATLGSTGVLQGNIAADTDWGFNIAGSGTVKKTGTAQLTLSGTVSNTTNLDIAAGSLQLKRPGNGTANGASYTLGTVTLRDDTSQLLFYSKDANNRSVTINSLVLEKPVDSEAPESPGVESHFGASLAFDEYHHGRFQVNSLTLNGNTLYLKDSHTSNCVSIFRLAGGNAGSGTVELQQLNDGNNRHVALALAGQETLEDALLKVTAINSQTGDKKADVAVAISASEVHAGGLEAAAQGANNGTDLYMRGNLYLVSRDVGINYSRNQNASVTTSDDTVRTLVITGGGGTFNGTVMDNLNITMDSTATGAHQTFAGNVSAFNGVLTVKKGTLSVNTAMSADASAKLEGGTLELGTGISSLTASGGTLQATSGTTSALEIGSMTLAVKETGGSANLTVGSAATIGALSVSGNATLTLNAATSISNSSVASGGNLNLAGTADISLAAAPDSSGTLTMTGSGNVDLQGRLGGSTLKLQAGSVSGTLSSGTLELGSGTLGDFTLNGGVLGFASDYDMSGAALGVSIADGHTLTFSSGNILLGSSLLDLNLGQNYYLIGGFDGNESLQWGETTVNSNSIDGEGCFYIHGNSGAVERTGTLAVDASGRLFMVLDVADTPTLNWIGEDDTFSGVWTSGDATVWEGDNGSQKGADTFFDNTEREGASSTVWLSGGNNGLNPASVNVVGNFIFAPQEDEKALVGYGRMIVGDADATATILQLNTDNSDWHGEITIMEGAELRTSTDGALGSGGLHVQGTLALGGTLALANAIDGSGDINVRNGTVTLSQFNSFSGALNIGTDGNVLAEGNGALGNSSITMTGNASVTASAAQHFQSLTMGGTSSYTADAEESLVSTNGVVLNDSANLTLSAVNALGTTPGVTLNGSSSMTVGAVGGISDGASVTLGGSSTLTLATGTESPIGGASTTISFAGGTLVYDTGTTVDVSGYNLTEATTADSVKVDVGGNEVRWTGYSTINRLVVDAEDEGKLILGRGSRTENNTLDSVVVNNGTLSLAYGTALKGIGADSNTTNTAITMNGGTLELQAPGSGSTGGLYVNSDLGKNLFHFNQTLTLSPDEGKEVRIVAVNNTYGLGLNNNSSQALIYDGRKGGGTATISADIGGFGRSAAQTVTFQIGDSANTNLELDIQGTLGNENSDRNVDSHKTTLKKTGAGTMRIGNTNYLPKLEIAEGTVIAAHASALGKTTAANDSACVQTVTVGTTTTTATLDVQADCRTALLMGNDRGVVTNSTATAHELTIGEQGNKVRVSRFEGSITGNLSLLLINGDAGAVRNKLTLTGANTYTGETTIWNNAGLYLDGGSIGTSTGGNGLKVFEASEFKISNLGYFQNEGVKLTHTDGQTAEMQAVSVTSTGIGIQRSAADARAQGTIGHADITVSAGNADNKYSVADVGFTDSTVRVAGGKELAIGANVSASGLSISTAADATTAAQLTSAVADGNGSITIANGSVLKVTDATISDIAFSTATGDVGKLDITAGALLSGTVGKQEGTVNLDALMAGCSLQNTDVVITATEAIDTAARAMGVEEFFNETFTLNIMSSVKVIGEFKLDLDSMLGIYRDIEVHWSPSAVATAVDIMGMSGDSELEALNNLAAADTLDYTKGGVLLGTSAANGQVVDVWVTFTVPEPTTGTLSVLALAALAARRRRKE